MSDAARPGVRKEAISDRTSLDPPGPPPGVAAMNDVLRGFVRAPLAGFTGIKAV